MTVYTVPLTNVPQSFSIQLANVAYNMTSRYNERQGWILDIADVNNNLILCNIPLTTGRDLLEPHANLNFGGALFVSTDGNTDIPTIDNLGVSSNLYFAVL